MIDTEKISLKKLHKSYVKNTLPEALVHEVKILLCYVANAVYKGGELTSRKVYINSVVLKHMYDKRPARQFDFILENLANIVSMPEALYRNGSGKRGSLCFVKSFHDSKYIAVLETLPDNQGHEVVTSFEIDDKYIEKYTKIWSWEDGIPPS